MVFGAPNQSSSSGNQGGASSGFTFGTQVTSAQKSVSFSLPSYSQATSTGGSGTLFSSPFPPGTVPEASTNNNMAGGFTFATPATNSAGFTLGSAPSTTGSTGFPLGGASTGTSGFTLGSTLASTGIPSSSTALGGTAIQQATVPGFGTQAKPAHNAGFPIAGIAPLAAAPTVSSTGFTLGGTKPASAGFTLGGTSMSSGLNLGGTAKPSSGFTLGGATIGTLGGVAPTSTLSGIGSSGFTLGGAAKTSSSGFNLAAPLATSATTVTSRGLGGADPQTTSAAGSSGTAGKSSDSKSAKENGLPADVINQVVDLKKFLRNQKGIREEIARVSPKEISGIQEEVNNLRQMLSVVSNGVHRNAAAIEKLKVESAMELKHSEIAQRTKDTPAGLQYENTAPTIYFYQLVEKFENHMQLYRQQIEEMENYLVAMHQPGMFTPQELTVCLRKLHETFLALAAQLHGVHEAVKAQKEQYLNYRKAIHNDSTNVFEVRKRNAEKTKSIRSSAAVGPTPFVGLTNSAAVALASSLSQPQQPQAQSHIGVPPTFGLAAGSTLGGGTTAGLPFGSTFGGFGSNPATGLFGTPQSTSTFGTSTGFGAGTQQSSLFGTQQKTTGFGGFGTTTGTQSLNLRSAPPTAGTPGLTSGLITTENKPFQLGNPPAGSKRGKR